MNREKIFEIELDYIKNEKYKENTKKLLELVPDYFFEVPAASTGKYHPAFAQGEKGLVRHTKVAIRIAKDILDVEYMNNGFTKDEKDLMLIALLFHDSHKLGKIKERYTRFDHPLLAANFIRENKEKTTFTDKEIELLASTIASHMGQWNKSEYSDVILSKPKNKYEFFVHMCDYLSSKKYLDVKFDENSNII